MISNASPIEPLTKTRFSGRENEKTDYPDWDHVALRFRRLLLKTKQTQTMRAMVLNRYGGLDQVMFADLQRPVAMLDEILVQALSKRTRPVRTRKPIGSPPRTGIAHEKLTVNRCGFASRVRLTRTSAIVPRPGSRKRWSASL